MTQFLLSDEKCDSGLKDATKINQARFGLQYYQQRRMSHGNVKIGKQDNFFFLIFFGGGYLLSLTLNSDCPRAQRLLYQHSTSRSKNSGQATKPLRRHGVTAQIPDPELKTKKLTWFPSQGSIPFCCMTHTVSFLSLVSLLFSQA